MKGGGVTLSNLRRRLVTLSACHLAACLVMVALAFTLALLPFSTLALAIFYGLLILLALIDPIFGLYWAILSVPVQEVVHLPGGLSYTQGAMLLAVGAWALRVLAHPERPLLGDQLIITAKSANVNEEAVNYPGSSRSWQLAFLTNTRAGDWPALAGQFWPWAAFLWALLLAAVCSPYSRVEGFKETLRWSEAFLIWLMVVALARRPWQIAGLIACLLIAPAAEAVIGLAQFITGSGPPSFRITPDLPFVRAYGTIGQPNSFAGYINMAWPLAAAMFGFWILDCRLSAKSKIGYPAGVNLTSTILLVLGSWCLSMLLLAALAASLSRGAWVGAACGVMGMALALGPRARRWSLAGLGLGALGLALGGAGLLPDVLAVRLASITRYLTLFDAGAVAVTPQNFAVVERMAQMQAGWRMFLAHLFTGVGPGNYTLAYPLFAVGTWYASRGHAHNYYIHMAAEAGILGALAYLALLSGVIRQVVVILRSNNRTIWRSAAIGCCGIIAAVAGHDLFENLHALSMGIQLAAVWGLVAVLNRAEGLIERAKG
jgi:O-antigen ligase